MGIYYDEGIFGLRVERRDNGSVVFEEEFDKLTAVIAARLQEAVRENALRDDQDFYFCVRECFSTTIDYPLRTDVGYSWTRIHSEEIRTYLTEFVSATPAREARMAAARDVAKALQPVREDRMAAARAVAKALHMRREHCGIYGYTQKPAPSMLHLTWK